MKNKTLLNCILLTFLVNVTFAVFLVLVILFENKQPYLALFITFTIFAYHLDIRFLIGALVSLFKGKINVEKKSHRISEKEYKRLVKLKVKKWKDRLPTLFKKQFTLKGAQGVDEVIRNCINAESVHWLCFFFGFGAIPLGCLLSFEELWLYILTSCLASLFVDLPFVLIQRYNRYRLYSLRDKLSIKETRS